VIRLAAANALTGMKKKLPPEHLAAKLDRIIQQTVRMSGIIDHMRIFGRKSEERVQPCRAADAIEGAMQVVGAHFRLDNIEVATRFDDGLPGVLCRQAQLEQVIINLLQNARDAINDKRKRDDNAFTGRIRIDVSSEVNSSHSVRVDVADNAGGIPPEIADRIFQPFFTTKPPGKGTGLGLSVSFGIIREHGGTISVANAAEGAVFTIHLPAAEVAPAVAESAPEPRPASLTNIN
jgi:C4-dicarboxylate-specific signal transduction histidine kinase